MDRFFQLKHNGTTVRRELLGGLTTWLTMVYIAFVNPAILSAGGMPADGAFLATCLAAAFASLVMGLWANYPIALAPGMGLNAFFAFGICGGAGVPWPTALGLVFWSGLLFILLTVTGVRTAIVRAFPETLRHAGAAGIGLFIAFIGLKQAGLVVDHPATLVTLGELSSGPTLVALAGLLVIGTLLARGVATAVFWGLLVSGVLAMVFGIVAAPTGIAAVPSGALPGLSIDLMGALSLEYVPLILVILFFDVFDTLGTLMGVATEGGLLDDEGQLPRLERAMTADAMGSLAGALFGTSTVTSYIESSAGVSVGARTGLAAVTTGVLFLATLALAPLATVIGAGTESGLNPVTAPALVAVGLLMARGLRHAELGDPTESLPALVTAVTMPLTFNISHGLAAGITAWVVLKAAAGKGRAVHPILWVLSGLFVLRYLLLPVG